MYRNGSLKTSPSSLRSFGSGQTHFGPLPGATRRLSLRRTVSTYRICNWSDHFEKSDSKKCRQMLWVAIPTKHDGLGYRTMISAENGPAMYGAWVVMVAVAAKCPKRGTLDLTPEQIAIKTGLPSGLLRDTIRMTIELGWLEEVILPSGRYPDYKTRQYIQYKQNKQPRLTARNITVVSFGHCGLASTRVVDAKSQCAIR